MSSTPRSARLVRQARPGRHGIPDATVARLPIYLRVLTVLAAEGVDTVSSEALAASAGVGSAKLRKDLASKAPKLPRGRPRSKAAKLSRVPRTTATSGSGRSTGPIASGLSSRTMNGGEVYAWSKRSRRSVAAAKPLVAPHVAAATKQQPP